MVISSEYEIGEEVQFFCGLCQEWVLAKIVGIDQIDGRSDKLTVVHDGDLFPVYSDNNNRIRKYE